MQKSDELHSENDNRWQVPHFAEHQSLNDRRQEPTARADIIRNQLAQIEFARASSLISLEGARHLMVEKFENYCTVMDNAEGKDGVENYACDILSQIGYGISKDDQLWYSSMQSNHIPSSSSIKRLDSVLKGGIQMMKSDNHYQKCVVSSEHVNVSLKSTLPRSIPTEQLKAKVTIESKEETPRDLLPYFSSRGISCSQKIDEKMSRMGSLNVQCDDTSSENYFQSRTSANQLHQKEDQLRHPKMQAGDSNFTFVTARYQLGLIEQKKFGQSKAGSRNESSSSPYLYGSNKRSLGARRRPDGKFVPPVIGFSDNNNDRSSSICHNNPSKSCDTSTDDSIPDPRLKNFEPRIIELITREIMDHSAPVAWDDIAGLEFVKKTIKEIVIWPMLRPDIFTGLRGPPKGLLLFGPPGTGKTLIGKCIASQSRSTFFSISASSLTSKWVGEGEKMVRALFAVAKVHQPAVVFIDEIDSLLSHRSDGEHESSRRIKTEFLIQLDGTTTGEDDRVLVVGATNRPQEIDEAARRRFVKRLYIPLPEDGARKQIVQLLMSQQSNSLNSKDFDDICLKTSGYSGADMANLCREAALGPIRSLSMVDIEHISADEVRPINFIDFQSALKQVRASVSNKDLDNYIEWNKQFGSWDT